MAFCVSKVKTENHREAIGAKITIRRKVIEFMGNGAVFDAFAGSGQMYNAVWKDAAHYEGCDLKPQFDSRLMFCADNRRVLRAIDLTQFHIFDLDSYGSPWEQVIIIAARRNLASGERLGLILTEGSGLAFKMNNVAAAISNLTGVRKGAVGMSRKHDEIIERSLLGLSRRMNCTIEKRWQANSTGKRAPMRYIGLVLKGKG